MHKMKTEFKQVDGEWQAVDVCVQPQADRCLVLMDRPKAETASGLVIPDAHQNVTWEGVVVASGPQSNYQTGQRVVIGQHAGIREYQHDTKDVYVVANNDEVIHVVAHVTRKPTEAELAGLRSEDDARAAIEANRRRIIAEREAATVAAENHSTTF